LEQQVHVTITAVITKTTVMNTVITTTTVMITTTTVMNTVITTTAVTIAAETAVKSRFYLGKYQC
jgi:hypothetical protein